MVVDIQHCSALAQRNAGGRNDWRNAGTRVHAGENARACWKLLCLGEHVSAAEVWFGETAERLSWDGLSCLGMRLFRGWWWWCQNQAAHTCIDGKSDHRSSRTGHVEYFLLRRHQPSGAGWMRILIEDLCLRFRSQPVVTFIGLQQSKLRPWQGIQNQSSCSTGSVQIGS